MIQLSNKGRNIHENYNSGLSFKLKNKPAPITPTYPQTQHRLLVVDIYFLASILSTDCYYLTFDYVKHEPVVAVTKRKHRGHVKKML